jgi:hypothetical protein
VNGVLFANIDNLQKVYQRSMGLNKKSLSIEDALNLFARQPSFKISEQSCLFCFGMSKQTVVNERGLLTQLAYFSMEFVEFLEMVGRVAQTKFPGEKGLESKIEDLFDEMLPLFGLTRNQPIAEIEESYSEDEV